MRMSDEYILINVYNILDEQITSFVTYEKKADEMTFTSKLHRNNESIGLPYDLLKSYNPEELNLKTFFTPWEDPFDTDQITRSVTVEEVSADRENKPIIFPIFTKCENCQTHFPSKYQFQRHQCDENNVILNYLVYEEKQNYECAVCEKTFANKHNLERHMSSHERSGQNVCEHCQKPFMSDHGLRAHKESHCKKAGSISKFYRSDITVWKCIRCNEVFSSRELVLKHTSVCSEVDYEYELDPKHTVDVIQPTTHLSVTEGGAHVSPVQNSDVLRENNYSEKILTEILLQCEFCNRIYIDKNMLLLHQRKHTTEKNYECIDCNTFFESYAMASAHWLTKCSESSNSFFLPKLTFCEFCNRTFKSHDILYKHKDKKHHYTPKIHLTLCFDDENVAPMFNQQRAVATLARDILSKLDSVVETAFTSRNQRDESEHLTFKVKSEPTSANTSCINLSPKESSRTNKYYTSVYKFQCQMCVKVFDIVNELKHHRQTEHSTSFKCDDCSADFQTMKGLLIHTRSHRNMKPYACVICDKSYSQTSHLWQHMRFHQGIKPFACPHEGCEARYTIRPDLKDHIRKVHTRERPFKCNVCGKAFLTGSVYYQHRLIHTNDRRYKCEMCTMRFFRADALNNHRRIHTNERPFPCTICGRQFRQKGDRNKHIKTQHHGDVART